MKIGNLLPAVGAGARHRGDDNRSGHFGAGIADEGLRSIDDPLVAFQRRTRGDVGRIGAGVRLRQPDRADLAAIEDRAEVAVLLLIGAIVREQACDCRIGHQRVGDGAIHPRKFLQHDHVGKPFATGAAPTLRIGQAGEAELAGTLPDIVGKGFRFPQFFRDGSDFVFCETAYGVAYRGVLFV